MKSLTQKINGDIVRIYEGRRNEAFRIRDLRVQELYRQFPGLEALDRRLRLAGLSLLQGKVEGETPEPFESFEAVEAERRAYLRAQGIEDGYDQPAYHCPSCGDTGRLGGSWCPCRRQIIRQLLPVYFPDALAGDHLFSNFNLNLFSSEPTGKAGPSPRDLMADYLQMAQLYTGHFDRLRDRNLFFSGAPGTGKTFLMQCMGHRLMDDGYPVVYITAPNLFDLMTRHKRQQAAFRPDPDMLEEASMLFQALHHWDLLLIDDLGTEPATPETYAQLILLLDARQSRKLATIIASNIEAGDFSRIYDGRIASRLHGNFLKYEFLGDDLRLRKKSEKE
ncbi:MAG: ATP-binding protein [Saccharofermentanales bacterium]